jgi:hypothetical protein
VKGILDELTNEEIRLYLVLQGLCRQQNGGTIQGVVTVSQQELEQASGSKYPHLGRRLHHLESLDLIRKDARSQYILLNPKRPWVVFSEKKPQKVVVSSGKALKPRNGLITSSTKSLVDQKPLVERSSTEDCVRAQKKFTSVDAEVVTVVATAFKRLTVPYIPGSPFVKKVRGLAAKRLNDGHTREELLRVVAWALQRWISGDRFLALRSFQYLWGDAFAERLGMAQSSSVGTGMGRPQEEWDKREPLIIKMGGPGGRPAEEPKQVQPKVEQPY